MKEYYIQMPGYAQKVKGEPFAFDFKDKALEHNIQKVFPMGFHLVFDRYRKGWIITDIFTGRVVAADHDKKVAVRLGKLRIKKFLYTHGAAMASKIILCRGIGFNYTIWKLAQKEDL